MEQLYRSEFNLCGSVGESHSVRVGEAFASAKASACAERLLQGKRSATANGISTLSAPQNYSNTDEIDWTKPTLRERRSISKNPQQLCSNIPAAKPVTRTELFFGLRKPNGTEVNNAEFQRFLVGGASPVENREVTPRFPDGFTVISGRGQFKDARGTILQERSKLLILIGDVGFHSSTQPTNSNLLLM